MSKKGFALLLVIILSLTTACSNSTTPADQTTNSTTAQTETTLAEMIKCPHCNQEVTSEAKFCSACGKEIAAVESEAETDAETTTESVASTTEATDMQVGDYPFGGLVRDVPQFVTTLDPTEIAAFGQMKFEVSEDYYENIDTGELKMFYTSDAAAQGIRIRIPQLTEQSELAASINEDIISYFAAFDPVGLYYLEIDYDAYIYNDVLSIKLTQDTMYEGADGGQVETIKTYHFDIASGKLVELSSEQLLERLNVSTEQIREFAFDYLVDYLFYFYKTEEAWQNMDVDIEAALALFDERLSADELAIFKNDNNNYYSLELAYSFFDGDYIDERVRFTLADTPFKMALLSQPRNAIGLIYKDFEEQDMPATSLNNRPLKLHKLNDAESGQPIYVTSFNQFNDVVKIYDLEIIEAETGTEEFIFVEKLTDKELTLENNSEAADVYLYYTILPEIYPHEAVYMVGENEYGEVAVADAYVYDDLQYGGKIQYVYGDVVARRYVDEEGSGEVSILLNPDLTFEAVGEDGFWADYGMPMTAGTYSSDTQYVYLFPNEADREAGAAEYYVLLKDEQTEALLPVFSGVDGWIDGNLILYVE